MDGLPGTSLTHVAVAGQPDPGTSEPACPGDRGVVRVGAAGPGCLGGGARCRRRTAAVVFRLRGVAMAATWRGPVPPHGRFPYLPGRDGPQDSRWRNSRTTGPGCIDHWRRNTTSGWSSTCRTWCMVRLTTGGEAIDGIAELGFRSPGAFAAEMYDSDEGRAIISADVATFVGRAACGLYQLVAGIV